MGWVVEGNVTVVDSNGTAYLRCPRCAGEYLHHDGVIVFDREEDAENTTYTGVSSFGVSRTTVPSADTDNPSLRRDGLAVQFWCEACGKEKYLFELTIAQHKGLTEIGWRYARKRGRSK